MLIFFTLALRYRGLIEQGEKSQEGLQNTEEERDNAKKKGHMSTNITYNNLEFTITYNISYKLYE